MNSRPASGLLPSMRAMMLPRSGVRPSISDCMPSSASQSRMYSQTGRLVARGHEAGIDGRDADKRLFKRDDFFALFVDFGE